MSHQNSFAGNDSLVRPAKFDTLRRQKRKTRGKQDKRKKVRLLECHYCGVPLYRKGTPHPRGAVQATKDHVVARSLGGLDIRWNIVWSCRADNEAKADKYSENFCSCAFCKRTRRRHWERFGIRDPHGHTKSKRAEERRRRYKEARA